MKRAERLPVWDLTDFFDSPDDPRVAATLKRSLAAAKRFSKRYRGKLAGLARKPERFLAVLTEYELIAQNAFKLSDYSYLRFAENATDAKRGSFLQNVRERLQEIQRELLFFELEMASLSTGVLQRLINDRRLGRVKNYLRKIVRSKPHRRTEPEEQILADKKLTGGGAFVRLFDEELAAKRFRLGKKSVGEAEVLDLLHNSNRRLRVQGANALTAGLTEESRRLTFIFNTVLQDHAIDSRYGRYSTPEAMRHLANETDQQSVDAMVSAVDSGYGIVANYYRFKGKLLGVKKLYDYDRYAPIPGAGGSHRYSFQEARKLIVAASERFSPLYARTVDEFFSKRWIHAAAQPGKASGAFCSFATPDLHPYVLVNYSGTLREVLTLAHELGHGAHAALMRPMGYLNFDVPLTVAETASVFGEMLVFDHLKRTIRDRRELLSIYCGKIEEVCATVFRQTAMYRFEQRVHEARAKEGELSTARIGELWMKEQRNMFRGSVELRPDYSLWWSYISHFLHVPFYVYAYAFGELLTLALYARYEEACRAGRGEEFAARYLEMLAAGGSRSPEELVKPFGISLRSRRFWGEGIAIIKRLVAEARALHRA